MCEAVRFPNSIAACVRESRAAACGSALLYVMVRLLFAETLKPNTSPKSVHEIRFSRPVRLHAFRLVCNGERPHDELPFTGETPNIQLTVELFACEHGKDSLCTALLPEPFLRHETNAPSTLQALPTASSRCTYLVVRCGSARCSPGRRTAARLPTPRPRAMQRLTHHPPARPPQLGPHPLLALPLWC